MATHRQGDKMMHIAIDLTPSIQGHAGIGRYAEELTQALWESCPPDEQLTAFYTDPQRRRPNPPLDKLPVSALSLPNKQWRLSALLAHLMRLPQDRLVGQPDIFWATDHLLPFFSRTASVFTLYDLSFKLFPHVHTLLNRWFLGLMMPHFVQAADAIVVISESTKRDAVTSYQIEPDKIHVVYGGVNAHFKPVDAPQKLNAVRHTYCLPDRFLLYVGVIEPRKNLPTLFDAFKRANSSDVKLVIAGKKGWLYSETFARVQELGLEQNVIFTGFVPDDDLPALYSLAEAFVFPSLYEGLGLPVLEAMACGAPTICSDVSSLPEVAGDAALLVAPTDVRGWAEAMAYLTQNAALRADLRERGLHRAARFTWEAAARQTREVYRELYARRP
jgi:glycosyltransferase involved in cell wall biosynthesis